MFDCTYKPARLRSDAAVDFHNAPNNLYRYLSHPWRYILQSGPGFRTCLVQTGAKLGPDSEIAPLERLRGKILERRTLTHAFMPPPRC